MKKFIILFFSLGLISFVFIKTQNIFNTNEQHNFTLKEVIQKKVITIDSFKNINNDKLTIKQTSQKSESNTTISSSEGNKLEINNIDNNSTILEIDNSSDVDSNIDITQSSNGNNSSNIIIFH